MKIIENLNLDLKNLKVPLHTVRVKIKVDFTRNRVKASKNDYLDKDIKLNKNLHSLRILFNYKKKMKTRWA